MGSRDTFFPPALPFTTAAAVTGFVGAYGWKYVIGDSLPSVETTTRGFLQRSPFPVTCDRVVNELFRHRGGLNLKIVRSRESNPERIVIPGEGGPEYFNHQLSEMLRPPALPPIEEGDAAYNFADYDFID